MLQRSASLRAENRLMDFIHSVSFYFANGRTDSRGLRSGGLVTLIERRKVGWLLKEGQVKDF